MALVLAIAPSAALAEGSVFVLKANGEILKNGQLVNLTGVTKPEYLFKTKVFVEGSSGFVEQELECENYLEQGRIQREPATGVWRVIEAHPIEICEGSPWLEEGTSTNRLTLAPPNLAFDESTVELSRTGESLRAEERKQAEKGQEVDPREPFKCVYVTARTRGTFTKSTKKPLIAKLKNKMAPSPLSSNLGCFKKANWFGSFSLNVAGAPVFLAFETPPSVSGVNPTEGPEAEGTSVEISGSGFTGATAVSFGATSAVSFKVNSGSSITATAPKGSGTVDVTVTTPVSTSAATAADHYTFQPPPTVSSVTPNAGTEKGGTEVTIAGTNFTSGSTVKFGTNPATGVKMNSSESLTATSPAGTLGTMVDVTVTTAGGTSATSSNDLYTYVP
ncbi:MAG TPA: IPT/TIG domain-containing protein [Solirubrobacteraceae bacterium]|nr:IPT/TIG domain-containing protein [Solirubrobacteraceae bacterium]